MILIVSFPGNEHVDQVRAHLRVPHTVLDLADFPERASLSFHGGGAGGITLRTTDGTVVDLERLRSVWLRRIRPYGLDPRLGTVGARFAWSECHEAIEGVWQCVPAYWMNPPAADHAAQRKLLQLRVAERVGLTVPETLVTNDPAAAADFVDGIRPGR